MATDLQGGDAPAPLHKPYGGHNDGLPPGTVSYLGYLRQPVHTGFAKLLLLLLVIDWPAVPETEQVHM